MTTQDEFRIENPSGHRSKFSMHLKYILLLGFISFVAYANTVKNGFVFDDNDAIKENKVVAKGIRAIPELLATPYRYGSLKNSNDYYRPLSLVTFAAEYEFSELNPVSYHFINVLLFAGCVILLFLFLDELFERQRTNVAFIASLLFALHPIHTEVVANIKSRDELLCFFFAFISLNVFIKYVQTGKFVQLVVAFICFFLSLLSKETVVTFLAVIPLIFFFYRNENRKRSVHIMASVLLAVIVFLTIRYSVLSHYNVGKIGSASFIENPLVKADLSFESRIATAVLVSGYYIKFLFFPYPLISDYSYNSIPFAHFSDPLVLVSLPVYLFLIFAGIRCLFKNQKDPYAFAILFYLITISLFTNILFLLAIGERFTFFGSVGFCLALALILEKYAGKASSGNLSILKQPKILGVIIPIALIYLFITVDRNGEWRDNYTLFTTDIPKSPNNCRLRYFVGYELEKTVAVNESDPLSQKQTREEAIGYFRQAINIYPEFADAYANAGYLFFNISMYDSAEAYDKQALKINPGFHDVRTNLAKVYFVTRKYRQSIALCKTQLDLDPNDAEAYANLSACYGSIGKYDSAIHYASMGLAVNPEFNTLYQNIALCYKLMGNVDSASKYELIARRYNPTFKLN